MSIGPSTLTDDKPGPPCRRPQEAHPSLHQPRRRVVRDGVRDTPGGTPMAAVCLLFSVVPPPGLAHRLILFLSWPGTHSTLHSMAPSSSFALVLMFIMVKGRGKYWTHCSAIHPWVPCISFQRGLALGGPLGPNTVRPPNLQYPQRHVGSPRFSSCLSGLIEPSLHLSCHLPSPSTREPYPPSPVSLSAASGLFFCFLLFPPRPAPA